MSNKRYIGDILYKCRKVINSCLNYSQLHIGMTYCRFYAKITSKYKINDGTNKPVTIDKNLFIKWLELLILKRVYELDNKEFKVVIDKPLIIDFY